MTQFLLLTFIINIEGSEKARCPGFQMKKKKSRGLEANPNNNQECMTSIEAKCSVGVATGGIKVLYYDLHLIL